MQRDSSSTSLRMARLDYTAERYSDPWLEAELHSRIWGKDTRYKDGAKRYRALSLSVTMFWGTTKHECPCLVNMTFGGRVWRHVFSGLCWPLVEGPEAGILAKSGSAGGQLDLALKGLHECIG